jgi:hypothetical protein
MVRRAAQKVVLSGYVARSHRDIRGPCLGALLKFNLISIANAFFLATKKETEKNNVVSACTSFENSIRGATRFAPAQKN